MRFLAVALIVLGILVVAGCVPEPPREPRQAALPHLAGTVQLPGADGRVHIIKTPDPLGFETSTCFVLVSDSGAQSIACAPPRVEITEPEPAP